MWPTLRKREQQTGGLSTSTGTFPWPRGRQTTCTAVTEYFSPVAIVIYELSRVTRIRLIPACGLSFGIITAEIWYHGHLTKVTWHGMPLESFQS
jgi:hypothetical protein